MGMRLIGMSGHHVAMLQLKLLPCKPPDGVEWPGRLWRDASHRWPDYLSQRLNAKNGKNGMAVLNQGISGNRLLHDM